MAFRPLNIVGGWYTDEALPWTQQDCCNFIPFVAELPGAISQVIARDAPGLKPFVQIASDGGVRGLRDVEGKLLVVAGTGLYQISNTGIAIPRGTVPGDGPVCMSHNQQGIANEVLVGNGSAAYVYNTSTLVFNRVTDPGFPGAKALDYLHSYLLGVEPLGRFWFHSDLADAESYNTLDRYEAETSPDRIVTLAVSNEEVVVFGQRTTDFFVDTGAGTGTFQAKGVSCNVGCASTNGVVKLDNTLMWLDNYGVFQRMEGYTPVPISTRALESAIDGLDWSRAVATTYQDKGRKIAYWTFPSGPTFGYDVTTRMWHRLASYGRSNFRAPQIVYWNKKWIAGDRQSGKLYELDWDYMLEDYDLPHVRKLKTAPLHGDGAKIQAHALKFVFDTGGPATVPVAFPEQPDPPTITGDPPDGSVGTPWGPYSFNATGGSGSYAFSLRPGSTVPAGLPTLTAAGVLPTGTPTTEATYTLIVRVTDTVTGLYDEITVTIAIGAVQIGFEWQYTGTFGTETSDICFGRTSDDEDLFLVCTQGPVGNGQIFTSPDGGAWTQRTDGQSWAYRSCAYGLVGGVTPTFVVSRDLNNVLVSNDCVTWAPHSTAVSDSYLTTIWDGSKFIRAGVGTSAENSADGIAWASHTRPTSGTARVGIAFEWAADRVVMLFCEGGAIHRTTNSGDSWSSITVPGDPIAAQNFTGAATDGTTIRAYKYGASVLTTYTSSDGGITWTWAQDAVGAGNYQAGACMYRNGNWFGAGAPVTGGEQIQLWRSPDGLVPWAAAVVQDYVDTYSAGIRAFAASDVRAVMVGNQSIGTNQGFAMTSPVLTP